MSVFSYLDHEVLAEAPSGLGPLLSERPHVVFEVAEVFGEGHEEKGSQLEQQCVPGFLRAGGVLEGLRQHHTPASEQVHIHK